MAYSQADLDLASHRVMEGEEVIAQLQALIERLRQDGESTLEAEEGLTRLEDALDQLKRRRDQIKDEMASPE